MTTKNIFNILLICVLAFGSVAQEKSILFTNAFLHVGNGKTWPSATVGVRGDKIDVVKNTLTYHPNLKKWDTVIDLKGAHMYPGLVAPAITLGLREIDAVRATLDYNDVGEINPHVRALVAFNVESDVVSTIRTNGVLISQATPQGGMISGSSSIMHLDGWNWEDAVVKADDGIHLNWPSFIPWRRDAFDKKNASKSVEDYNKKKQDIIDFFTLAKTYAEAVSPEIPELRLEAMEGVFKGDKRLYIHAEELQDLLDVIEFCKTFEIRFPVIVGGYDSHLITAQLRDAKIPVMLPRIHSLPMRNDDPIDHPYVLPSLLKKGNVDFCLQNTGDMEAMNARNIPFLAGHTTSFGLTEEEALEAISLSSCRIMGIGDEYGSIEEGKKATLFVSTGPALEMMTNNVTLALMNGGWVDLNNRQEALYLKYKGKYQK